MPGEEREPTIGRATTCKRKRLVMHLFVSGKRGYEVCYVVEVEVVVDLEVVEPVARSEQLPHLVTCCLVVVTCYPVHVP